MKVINHDQNYFVLRFDKGDEVMAGLAEFMKQEQVSGCFFYGIGACASAELGFYNDHIKDYRKKNFVEELEIVSLIGNGGQKDGQPFVHAHGMLSRTDFSTLGGHVFKMEVSATCEIQLRKLEGALMRDLNKDMNLNLLV